MGVGWSGSRVVTLLRSEGEFQMQFCSEIIIIESVAEANRKFKLSAIFNLKSWPLVEKAHCFIECN